MHNWGNIHLPPSAISGTRFHLLTAERKKILLGQLLARTLFYFLILMGYGTQTRLAQCWVTIGTETGKKILPSLPPILCRLLADGQRYLGVLQSSKLMLYSDWSMIPTIEIPILNIEAE